MKHIVHAILVNMVACEINDFAEILIYLGKCFKKILSMCFEMMTG